MLQETVPLGYNEAAAVCDNFKEPGMTLGRHKAIVNLSYEIKGFIDRNIGPLTSQEICMLGAMMHNILHLKA